MMGKFLGPFEKQAYALMRIVTGFLFSFHGAQKVFGIFADGTPSIGSQIWIGGVIELVCGVLIGIGLFTRPAAFLSSGTMAVAYAQFHWKFAFDEKLLPALNKGELAVVYAFVFLFIACRGGGIWSVKRS